MPPATRTMARMTTGRTHRGLWYGGGGGGSATGSAGPGSGAGDEPTSGIIDGIAPDGDRAGGAGTGVGDDSGGWFVIPRWRVGLTTPSIVFCWNGCAGCEPEPRDGSGYGAGAAAASSPRCTTIDGSPRSRS